MADQITLYGRCMVWSSVWPLEVILLKNRHWRKN